MPNLLDLIASPRPELETYPRPRTGLLGRLEHPEVYLRDQPLSDQDELRARGLDQLRDYGQMSPAVAQALRDQQMYRVFADTAQVQPTGIPYPRLEQPMPYQPPGGGDWVREPDTPVKKKTKKKDD